MCKSNVNIDTVSHVYTQKKALLVLSVTSLSLSHTHTHIHTQIHTRTHTHTHTHTHTDEATQDAHKDRNVVIVQGVLQKQANILYKCVHIQVCMYNVCTYIYVCMHIYIYVCMTP